MTSEFPVRASQQLKVSFEFSPPKTEAAERTLWETIERLAPLRPTFFSVTYGAGGSTRQRTHETVVRLKKETGIDPAAHLTCVAATQVRWAAGSMPVSFLSRTTVSCVRWRVEPPAP